MSELIIHERHIEPETTLFTQEIDVLVQALSLANEYLFAKRATHGSFVLDGQKYGKEAKLIIRGNFSQGAFFMKLPNFVSRSSDIITEHSINEVLKWPEKKSRFYFKGSVGVNSRWIPDTGIYRQEELLVMILNATHGRFLCSLRAIPQVGRIFSDEDRWLLCILAACFAEIGKEDCVLQESVQSILDENRGTCGIDAYDLVQGWFERQTLPAVKTWHAWHESANSAGELGLVKQSRNKFQ